MRLRGHWAFDRLWRVQHEEILFVKRKPYSSDHYYTDINNGTSPDRFVPENGIYSYNLRTQWSARWSPPPKCPGARA
jgi:hypothetical protein